MVSRANVPELKLTIYEAASPYSKKIQSFSVPTTEGQAVATLVIDKRTLPNENFLKVIVQDDSKQAQIVRLQFRNQKWTKPAIN